MDSQLFYWVLTGFAAVILYIIGEQARNNRQSSLLKIDIAELRKEMTVNQHEITTKVAVLQTTVEMVNHNLTVFLRTELDQLKEIAVDRNNGRE